MARKAKKSAEEETSRWPVTASLARLLAAVLLFSALIYGIIISGQKAGTDVHNRTQDPPPASVRDK